jgi:hypothetical protein
MDGSQFDNWTRRRFDFAAGGLLVTLLTFGQEWPAAAKKKKRKKCGKHKKRCQGKCIKRSQCCRDGDCPAGTYCCEGSCVSQETCCGSGVCPSGCPCRRTVEGNQACVDDELGVLCLQCSSSGDCAKDEQCFHAECGDDVTAICVPVCLMEV